MPAAGKGELLAFKDELPTLTRFLRKRFNTEDLQLELDAEEPDTANLMIADDFVAAVERDEDEGEICYQVEMDLPAQLAEVTQVLRARFNTQRLRVQQHPKKADMAEVFIGDEFVAAVYRDEDDPEDGYKLQMAVLDFDLEEMDD